MLTCSMTSAKLGSLAITGLLPMTSGGRIRHSVMYRLRYFDNLDSLFKQVVGCRACKPDTP